MPHTETRVTAWIAFRDHGLTAYRIWNAKTAHGMLQRHEWRRADGATWCEDWLAVPSREWTKGAMPVPADAHGRAA